MALQPTCRPLLLFVALVAILFAGLTPRGWMPAPGGAPGLVLCTGEGLVEMPGGEQPTAPAEPAPCAWALAGAPVVPVESVEPPALLAARPSAPALGPPQAPALRPAVRLAGARAPPVSA